MVEEGVGEGDAEFEGGDAYGLFGVLVCFVVFFDFAGAGFVCGFLEELGVDVG